MIAIASRHCPRPFFGSPLAASTRAPRACRIAGLSFILLAAPFAGGEALGQSTGCGRCGNAPAASAPLGGGAMPQKAAVEPIRRETVSWHDDAPKREAEPKWKTHKIGIAAGSASYTV